MLIESSGVILQRSALVLSNKVREVRGVCSAVLPNIIYYREVQSDVLRTKFIKTKFMKEVRSDVLRNCTKHFTKCELSVKKFNSNL